MRKTLLVLGLVATVAAPSLAYAGCHSRRVTGTVIGGLGGGVIGVAAAATAPWAILAAGLGALTGNLLASSTCHYDRGHWRSAYYRREHDYRGGYYRGGYYRNGYYRGG